MSMKKTSQSCKFPSFRQKLQRKASNLEHPNMQQFNQDCTLENIPSNQTDVSKKIQAKLRMRRATGSQKKISRQTADPSNSSEKHLQDIDPFEQCQQRINYLWENSQEVAQVFQNFSDSLDPQETKKLLLKERGVLQCHFVNQGYEQVIVGRLKKLGQKARAQRRCLQQQLLLGNKFDQRMKKLNQMLKPRS